MAVVVLVVIAVLTLSGCTSAVRWEESSTRTSRTQPSAQTPATPRRAANADTHTVRAGESLYAIALRYRLNARDIARWNQLGDGELIFPGQILRLKGPAATSAPTASGRASTPRPARPAPAPTVAEAPDFAWPAVGELAPHSAEDGGPDEGIRIRGRVGDPVLAAAPGRVVYSGDGLIGYGNLIIVKHSDRFLTAYGYNDALLVAEGDEVRGGQRIARMGRGPGRDPALHFEIRLDGKPVDPIRYLGSRQAN